MEKKRKLPARAAARSEQLPKKRHSTPREHSATPAPPEPSPEVRPTAAAPLPKSVQAGKPLPTIEQAQPQELLSDDDYQSVGESGVLAESLSRSRHRWINEGLFEKYWTKPHKRKGVLIEDPKNPPKDSMTRIGNVTITIEPHIIDAVMYTVKKPASAQAPPQAQSRPIIQYGPPQSSPLNPAASPHLKVGSPAPGNTAPGPTASPMPQNLPQVGRQTTTAAASPASQTQTKPLPATSHSSVPAGSPQPSQGRGVHAASGMTQTPATPSTTPLRHPASSGAVPPGQAAAQVRPANTAAPQPTLKTAPGAPLPAAQAPGTPSRPAQATTPKPAAAKPSPDDPVIALLAERASKDENLRNLMKRVAMGKAGDAELVNFQKIIDQLNVECKGKQAAGQTAGASRTPSQPPDKLFVDNRSVKYFADEVRTILDIVLHSNPKQKSADLKPPPESDPLVVLLVKTALEDQRTKDMIKRIAEGRAAPADGQDLKATLDRLHRDMKTVPRTQTQQARQSPAQTPTANTASNHTSSAIGPPPVKLPQTVQQSMQVHNAQASRSKGPPPPPKPDLAAVVFDFGTGDRYLFPTYSIIDFIPVAAGQQAVVSFLLVRKGSFTEYGGDPALDYYQPVTIRFSTPSGRSLENLLRVVRPKEEVLRYMEDVMDNMTRSEFLLLAMRLPRTAKEADVAAAEKKDKDRASSTPREASQTLPNGKGSTKPDTPSDGVAATSAPPPVAKPSVLWTSAQETTSKPVDPSHHAVKLRQAEEETQVQYERLIQTVTAKATETV